MKYSRLLIIGLFILVLSSLSYAVIDDAQVYYSLDDDDLTGVNPDDMSGNGNNGTNNLANTSGTGLINEDFVFDGTTDNFQVPLTSISPNQNHTWNLWVKTDGKGSSQQFIGYVESNYQYFIEYDGTRFTFDHSRPCVGNQEITYYVDIDDEKWHMVTMIWNATTTTLYGYVNGTEVNSSSISGSAGACGANGYRVGTDNGGTGNFYDGEIDEIAYYDSVKTAADLTSLFNSGAGYNPYGPPAGLANFSITAFDLVTGAGINTFNATVNGTSYNTTNGTITTNLLVSNSTLVNITIDAENYTQRNYTNHNISGALVANLTYFFYANESFEDTVLEIHYQTINLTVNTSSVVTDVTATLTYNGTSQTVQKTTYDNYTFFNSTFITPYVAADINLSFNWTYTIERASDNTTESIIQNQTVLVVAIDNCTTYTEAAVNFSIQDELNGTALTTDFQILFTVWNASQSVSRNYSFSETGATNYAFCIKPDYSELTSDYIIEYESSGYDARDYVAEDQYLSNVTQQITLYLLSSTVSSSVTLHVDDQNDDPIESILITVEKYDLGNNNYTMITSGLTNFNGQLVVNLQENETYSFKLYQNGDLESTEQVKVLSTTTDLFFKIISSIVTSLENYLDLNGLTSDLTYNNNTGLVTCTWSDPAALSSEVCLKVMRLAINGTVIESLECTSNVSLGTLTYTISNATGNQYVAMCRMRSSVDDLYYTIQMLNIDAEQRTNLEDIEGLLLSFILIGTLTFIGFRANPVVAIALLLFTTFICKVVGLLPLNAGVLIGLCISGTILIYFMKS